MNKWKFNLKAELTAALLISLVASLIVYSFINNTGNIVLGDFLYSSDYLEKTNQKYFEKFSDFIKKENIASTDTSKIQKWIQHHRRAYLTIVIVRNNQIIFDGLYENESIEDMESYYAYFGHENMKKIKFSDGEADVYFSGSYDFLFYAIWWVISGAFFFIILLSLFISFIRKKIAYIVTLEKEIKILETGGLEYEITVQGSDELASLANSLNQMRLIFIDNIKNEEVAVQSNYNLVATMSHDLRTPLTSMILYLGLIREHRYSDEKELQQYIEKIYEKSIRIQHMSNQLFERFLISENRESEVHTTQKVQYVFEDALSDMISYLHDQGYKTECNIEWPDTEITVITDFIPRIIDNISSNILKYSNPAFPIQIWFEHNKEHLSAVFQNKAHESVPEVDSSKIGVQNISIMMKKMGGICKIHKKNSYYKIELLFKISSQTHSE